MARSPWSQAPRAARVAASRIAADRGMFEILVDPGAEVSAGQPIACIHDVESPARTPATYRAERSGLLIGRRWPGPTRPGDCLAVIATEREPR